MGFFWKKKVSEIWVGAKFLKLKSDMPDIDDWRIYVNWGWSTYWKHKIYISENNYLSIIYFNYTDNTTEYNLHIKIFWRFFASYIESDKNIFIVKRLFKMVFQKFIE